MLNQLSKERATQSSGFFFMLSSQFKGVLLMYWLTAQEIADKLRISRATVYEAMKIPKEHGGLPYYAFGSSKNASKRVKYDDFEQWLETRKSK